MNAKEEGCGSLTGEEQRRGKFKWWLSEEVEHAVKN